MNKQFGQISKFSPYKEKVYEELKNAIIDNTLKPNTLINERDIAQVLGVSRTPVRDALRLLEFEGWVTTIPWKGTYVSDLLLSDVKEVMQLRQGLETLGLQLIEKVPEKELEILQNTLEKMFEHALRNEQREFMQYDKAFHLTLASLACNSRLVQIVSNLSDHIVRIGIRANTLEGRILESASEHKGVYDALKNGDLKHAKQLIQIHLEHTETAIAAVLNREALTANKNESGKDGNDG